MTKKQRLVIAGNGMAGARLLEEVIARGGRERFELVIFGAEPYGNYNRILLSNVLAGAHDPRDIFLNSLDWYAENGVTLHAGVSARGIDRALRVVHAGNGVMERYDTLVLATGSEPFVPRLERLRLDDGAFRPGAFVFRTLDDCQGMLRYATRARTAVVVGGGLLGLEAARGLAKAGLEVHVVHLMKHLMEVQIDATAGRMLRGKLEEMGVHVHLERATTGIVGADHVEGVVFADGATLDCEMVVIATGIRPNLQLAADAGIEVSRGVVVGDDLRTSDPAIYAIGECAEHRGKTYGLVAPLWEQARILADRLTGAKADAIYEGSRLSTKLKVAGVDLAVMGERDAASESDEEITYSEPARGIYKKLVVRDGRLVGATLLGDASNAPSLIQTFDRMQELPPNRAELLFALTEGAAASNPSQLPDDAQICNCNGVSKGAIVSAIKGGCRSLKVLCDATRAGTGCGACKNDVSAILEYVAGDAIAIDPSIHYYVPGVPLAKPELVSAIRENALKRVSAVFAALAGGKEDAPSKPGLASLLRTIWDDEYVDERDARFINDRVHANIQNDGTFSVIPRIYGGVTSAAQLRRIADVADKHGAKMVKITGGQRIDLLGFPKEKLPEVWRDLGMPSGHAYAKSFRTCKTCVGTEFCRYGVGDSTALGVAIERRFQGIESPGKLKLATAGCPRNCSEATTKDVGAVAIEGGRWEILVGGAAGARVRKGDLLCTVDTHDEVLTMMGRFMQYYRENAKYAERTYGFVERVGIEEIRRIVVDDGDGIAARLDADMDAAVDAYIDPWLEADAPATATQFSSGLEGQLENVPRPREQLVTLRRAAGDR